MRVFGSLEELPALRAPVVTVGSFDGLHHGHRVLLGRVMDWAAETGGESVVVTFSPHPRQVLPGGGDIRLLNTLDEKIFLLDGIGIDNLVVIPFTDSFASLPHDGFIRDILAGRLGMKTFVVGFDHRFGHGRGGDASSLSGFGEELGFRVCEIPRQEISDNKVSSTAVRRLISAGDMAGAAELLGYRYIIMAGIKDGRDVVLPDKAKLLPPEGVYDVEVDRAGGLQTDKLSINGNSGLQLEKGLRVKEAGDVTIRFI